MARKYALSESESEPESATSRSAVPSDDALEQALRDTVANIYKLGKLEELTVKRVRLAAEKSLQLDEGFFKTQGDWKARSEEVIRNQVESEEKAAVESAPTDDESQSDHELSSEDAKPAKRIKTSTTAASRKRQKTSPSSANQDRISESVDEDDEDGVKPSAKRQTKATNKTQIKTSEEPASDTDAVNGKDDKSEDKVESESEMSVVIDEEPKPIRKRQKSAETTSRKGKKSAPAKGAKGKDADQDPNQAEIKRLQGWLVKCGIRKMWARELAPFDTPKAKIKHLKDMLKEAGMEGRYSVEKANRIREERELKADLELVQEGAKRWGKEAGSEDSEDGRPKRKLNRGRRGLAFLEDEDGEETD
ncbi:putative transcriptional regulator [Aspergillus saccharolyticus JOP 1030-1]|uniref:Transcriptional regulator n=1 Tax=Aspergillus saccharolyticus JOP 1030-1 TaxID=1450539 RepID=A0A318Z6E5_9EURO|nr:hypothetical protein BP01DRAFT_359943 [Aspergillus saccharolyticus JOP 1030-1]PYH41967.1 hypothetical protein BP01DRAFT_359943 [Aspergillus saccharolyticus JOP 1030-1]